MCSLCILEPSLETKFLYIFFYCVISDPPPKKMILSTTVPKEFQFSTDNRVKVTTSSSASHKEVDFVSQLRKPSSPVRPSFQR